MRVGGIHTVHSYRILAAPQSPVGTNFGDVPAETILPYCAQASGANLSQDNALFRIPSVLCLNLT